MTSADTGIDALRWHRDLGEPRNYIRDTKVTNTPLAHDHLPETCPRRGGGEGLSLADRLPGPATALLASPPTDTRQHQPGNEVTTVKLGSQPISDSTPISVLGTPKP